MSQTREPQAPAPQPTDPLLDHNYDGIQEFDNPMPKWWLWIFYATIAYAALYALNFVPGLGAGPGRIASYEAEVEAARARYAAAAPQPAAPVDDATLLALARDPQALAAGKEVFVSACASCHREDGGGSIGPNLTDDYWLHGARPMQLHATVVNGVLDKGMPAWNEALTPEQVARVVAYVTTLHDTRPANPKEPQGTKADDDAGEEPASGAGANGGGSHD